MTERAETKAEVSGAGCAILLGLIIVACAIGSLSESVYGWVTFGGGLLGLGLLAVVISAVEKSRP